MRQATLVLLVKDDSILLGMKKRGFGVGKWNGFGGKVDRTKDADVLSAAIREVKEEISVDLKDPKQVGVLHFFFPYKPEWNQDVFVFLARDWSGEPVESEEMAPQWFKKGEIPYDKMWSDDQFWLPLALEGKKIEGSFTFKEGELLDTHTIKIV